MQTGFCYSSTIEKLQAGHCEPRPFKTKTEQRLKITAIVTGLLRSTLPGRERRTGICRHKHNE